MPTRSELHREAVKARGTYAMTGGNQNVRRRYQDLGRQLYVILFGEVIDHPTRKLSRQIFADYESDHSIHCTHAVVTIAGCEDFTNDLAKELISHIRKGRDEEAISLLEAIGLSKSMATCRLQPLQLILR